MQLQNPDFGGVTLEPPLGVFFAMVSINRKRCGWLQFQEYRKLLIVARSRTGCLPGRIRPAAVTINRKGARELLNRA